MSGKNLTFKLVMESDNKSLVNGVQDSKKAWDNFQKAISDGAVTFAADVAKASKELEKIIPENTLKLADTLKTTLNSASDAINGAGDSAKATAKNFSEFGSKSEKALSQLKTDLVTARKNLEAFAKTSASPQDIDAAKVKVDQLEREVEEAETAFHNFHSAVGKANTKLGETESVANKAKNSFNMVKGAVGALVVGLSAVGIGLSAKELLATSDAAQQMGERLKNATGSTQEYNLVQDRLLELANKTFRPLGEMQEIYLATNGTMKSLGYTTEQILAVTESLSLSFTHNATRADQAQASQDALAKAMALGKVEADAWTTIITGADNVVGDMARSTGRTEEEIRKLGASGKISIKELTNALIESKDKNEQLATSMKNSAKDGATALANSLTALIGKMNEKHDISARLATAMLDLGSDMSWLETLFDDAASAVDAVSSAYSELGLDTDDLKNVISSLYDLFKELVTGAVDLGSAIGDVLGSALSSAASIFGSFIGEAATADEQVSFLTRTVQGLSIAVGFMSDGITALKIGLSLITGALFSVASAANTVMAALTWGDVSKQFAINADVMKAKAIEYYTDADKAAMEFNSKGMQRLAEAARTEQEIAQDKLTKAKADLAEIESSESASQQKRMNAVQAYASAAIAANDGMITEQLKAELSAKGYALAMDEAGKVSIAAMNGTGEALTAVQQKTEAIKVATENLRIADEAYLSYQKQAAAERIALESQIQQAKASGDLTAVKSAQDSITQINAKEVELQNQRNVRQQELIALNQATADGTATAYIRASEVAQKLGLDLDQSLNRASETFKASSVDIDSLSTELQQLGLDGQTTGNTLYLAWQKWLETAKSQSEIDLAKLKLKEFGDTGVISTNLVNQGLDAIKNKAMEIPNALSPVEQALERLGIKSKEQLILAAQTALNDFNTVMQSGVASQDQLIQAYDRVVQAAQLSGDAQIMAAVNAKAAYLGLEAQISQTAKTTVSSLSGMAQAAKSTSQAVQQSTGAPPSKLKDSVEQIKEVIEPTEDSNNDDYWEDFEKKMSDRVAKSNASAQARRSSNVSGVKAPVGTDSALASQPVIPDAPMIASSFDIKADESMVPKETVEIKIDMGTGQTATVSAAPDQANYLQEMLQQLETIRRAQ